jgi:electron transfer flavoprotein beta subunit
LSNIVVLLKVIEKTEEVNEPDLTALEFSLKVKEVIGGSVTALSIISSEDFVYLSREAYARGADRAVFIIDPDARTRDPFSSSLILAEAVRKVGDPVLLVSGEKSVDTPSGVLGGLTAGRIGLTHVYFAYKLHEIREDGLKLTVDLGAPAIVEIGYPCSVSVASDLLKPRIPNVKEKIAARRKRADVWKLKELGEFPVKDRLVKVERPVERERERVIMKGPEELAKMVAKELGWIS